MMHAVLQTLSLVFWTPPLTQTDQLHWLVFRIWGLLEVYVRLAGADELLDTGGRGADMFFICRIFLDLLEDVVCDQRTKLVAAVGLSNSEQSLSDVHLKLS